MKYLLILYPYPQPNSTFPWGFVNLSVSAQRQRKVHNHTALWIFTKWFIYVSTTLIREQNIENTLEALFVLLRDNPSFLKKIYLYSNFWRGKWQPTPVLLPEDSHGQRTLVGYSPWGPEESKTIEWLHCHFSLSCTGEGNGNPLQCSFLENPRDGGAWWAAIPGVTQSETQLKWLSSSSSSSILTFIIM